MAIERHQQGQADGQVVDCAAQQAVARLLTDAGVELVVEVHVVNVRPLDLAADALQGLEQGGRLHGRDFDTIGRIAAQPQRLQAGPQQCQPADEHHHKPELEAPLQQGRQGPGHHAQRQHQATQHPGVAQRRKGRHAAAVSAAVFGAGDFAHAHHVNEIGLVHAAALSSGFDMVSPRWYRGPAALQSTAAGQTTK